MDESSILTPHEAANLAVDVAHRKWWVKIGLLVGDVALLAFLLWASHLFFPNWWTKIPLYQDVTSLPQHFVVPGPGEIVKYITLTSPKPGWSEIYDYIVPDTEDLFPQTSQTIANWRDKFVAGYEDLSVWFNDGTKGVRSWVASNWLASQYLSEQDLLLPTNLVKFLPPEEAPIETWSGPPLRELPEEVVIEPVWEEIAQAVEDEGGTTEEAALLYATQQSECAAVDGNCVSSVGAEGYFQFMPTTWPEYAEADWSQYDLYESARAAYRMHQDLGLFNQSNKADYQDRFSGQDGGLVWNAGNPDSSVYDGYDQAGHVWDQAQEIIAAAEENVNPPPPVDEEPPAPLPEEPEEPEETEESEAPEAEPEKLKKLEFCFPTDSGANPAFGFGDQMWYGTHTGVDWNVFEGDAFQSLPAYAMVDGTITTGFDTTVDGLIELVPDAVPNVVIKYYHMDESAMPESGHVSCGQYLGIADGGGTTSTGPHLHVEVWENGAQIDPLKLLDQSQNSP